MKTLKLLFFLCFSLFWMTQAKAEPLQWQNDKIRLTAFSHAPQILIKAELLNGWHISWLNPGDAGVPVTFDWTLSAGNDMRLLNQSVPEKFLYDDIISQYGYSKTAYYLFELDSSSKNPVNDIILNIGWTACRDYCEPESTRFIFSDFDQTSDQEWPLELMEAESTFPEIVNWDFTAEYDNGELDLIIDYQNFDPDLSTQPFYFIPYQEHIIPASAEQKISISDHRLHIRTESETDFPIFQGGLLVYGAKAFALSLKNSEETTASLSLLFTAFLAGMILNLMPCVFPILSLKAMSLSHNAAQKKHLGQGLLYCAGVICCFMLIALILYVLRRSGEAIGWGFQLQSPVFVGIMLGIFLIIFLMMADIIQIKGHWVGYFDKISRINAFLTGFFAVLIASPCTGPLMGAVLGYAVLQPAPVYFPIFLALGFGYALPFTLIEFSPNVFLKILPKPGRWMNIIKYILAIPVFLTCLWLAWLLFHQLYKTQENNGLWHRYDPQTAETLIDAGKPVLINFTAKWCMTCLLNEKTTFSSQTFEHTVRHHDITLFKADWTNHQSEIYQALQKYQRSSIPLYVYYPPDSHGSYYILPQILTPASVQNILNRQNQDDN